MSVDTPQSRSALRLEKLVPVDTPTFGNGDERRPSLPKSRLNSVLSNSDDYLGSDSPIAKPEQAATKGGAEEMKDVQI